MAEDEPGSPKKRRRAATKEQPPTATTSGPAGNPFAGVSLFSGSGSSPHSAPVGNPFAGVSLFGDQGSSPKAGSGSGSPGSNPFAGVSLFGASAASSGSSTGASGNPFAGVSLFSSSSSTSGGGSAPSSNPFAGIPPGQLFASFNSSGSPQSSPVAAASAAPAPAFSFTSGGASGAASNSDKGGNPFTGISLFAAPPAGGNPFAAAVAGSSQGPAPATVGAAAASAEAPGPVVAQEAAAGGANDAPDSDAAEDSGAEDAVLIEGETGEEEEEVFFRAECKLWKLVQQPAQAPATGEGGAAEVDSKDSTTVADKSAESTGGVASKPAADSKTWKWQEKANGVVHINRHSKTGAGRLVMRMRGVGKLVLNTPVFPTGKYEKVGQKSVKFIGVDADEEVSSSKDVSLCSYRLSLQSGDQQGEFLTVLKEKLQVQPVV